MVLLAGAVLLAACSSGSGSGGGGGGASTTAAGPTTTEAPAAPIRAGAMNGIVPKPTSIEVRSGFFTLRPDTSAVVEAGADAGDALDLLRASIEPATGVALPKVTTATSPTMIRFAKPAAGTTIPAEGYRIEIGEHAVEVAASDHDGFVWAVQTLRQMLAPEASGATRVPGTFVLPAVTITDAPAHAWRGAMLDIARHFFGPDDIRTYVDEISLYKINRLHLHLTDDQGWRIEIESHPELTELGSRNEVGGGPGGFLTQDEYRDLVAYAAARGVTVVPEIDTPGHTNAALVADPSLNCTGKDAEPYTGTQVGFSSLCTTRESTYTWFDDVTGEIAKLTPGEWIHLGGDESDSTSDADYRTFVHRALGIVRDHGKTPVGWDEIGAADLGGPTIAQFWSDGTDHVLAAAGQGADVVLSPSAHTYLDMKHVAGGPGNVWAGIISTKTAYDWDPATIVPGLDEARILGVEAPLWTELIDDLPTIQQRTLPRLPAVAEVGWTPTAARDWADASERIARQAPRWDALGWAWTRDATVPFTAS